MARYYFHLTRGGQLVEDLEGEELPDLDSAHKKALICARELLSEAIRSGAGSPADAFVVQDQDGEQRLFVPLTEALPPWLSGQARALRVDTNERAEFGLSDFGQKEPAASSGPK
jgi:hypothetical protein